MEKTLTVPPHPPRPGVNQPGGIPLIIFQQQLASVALRLRLVLLALRQAHPWMQSSGFPPPSQGQNSASHRMISALVVSQPKSTVTSDLPCFHSCLPPRRGVCQQTVLTMKQLHHYSNLQLFPLHSRSPPHRCVCSWPPSTPMASDPPWLPFPFSLTPAWVCLLSGRRTDAKAASSLASSVVSSLSLNMYHSFTTWINISKPVH